MGICTRQDRMENFEMNLFAGNLVRTLSAFSTNWRPRSPEDIHKKTGLKGKSPES